MDKDENKAGNANESSLQECEFEDINEVVYQHDEDSDKDLIDNLPDAHPEPRPVMAIKNNNYNF